MEFLTDEGYQAAAAPNVATALRLAREREFQVAVCDVQLPDGDGLALLRKLQQLTPGVSGLIITAYAMTGDYLAQEPFCSYVPGKLAPPGK